MNSSTSSSDRAALVVAAIALAGFLALVGASELFVRGHVAPVDNFRRHAAFFHGADAVDAAFGDSHVARGFAGEAGFVNLAFPSENIRQIDWKIRRYYASRKPGRVILQADPHLFAAYRLRVALGHYADAIANQGRTSPLYVLDRRHRPQIIAYWHAALRGGGQLVSNVSFSPHGALLSGGNLARANPRNVRAAARWRIRQHQPVPRHRRAAAVDRYRKLVAWLLSRGAKVCLVSFPVSPAYMQALAETRNAQQMKRWRSAVGLFRSLGRLPGVRYVDHRRRVVDLAHFRDVDHLNRQGALTYRAQLLSACFD